MINDFEFGMIFLRFLFCCYFVSFFIVCKNDFVKFFLINIFFIGEVLYGIIICRILVLCS